MALAVKSAMDSDGIFIATNKNGASQSVDHMHVHVVPRNKKDGLRGFTWPRRKYESSDHATETAARMPPPMGSQRTGQRKLGRPV